MKFIGSLFLLVFIGIMLWTTYVIIEADHYGVVELLALMVVTGLTGTICMQLGKEKGDNGGESS